MKRILPITTAFWLVFALSPCPTVFAESGHNPGERRYRQIYELSNTSGSLLRDVFFDVRIPAKSHLGKDEEALQVGHPYKRVEDDSGNQWLSIHIKRLPPHGHTTVKLDFFPRYPEGNRASSVVLGVDSDLDAESRDWLARRVGELPTARSQEARARALFSFVMERLTPRSRLMPFQGAREALERGTGDCTEMAALYRELALLSDMPAEIVTGYRVQGSGKLGPSALHNWVEVQVGESTMIVDPFEKVFDGKHSEYIPFLRGTPTVEKNSFIQFRISSKEVRVRQMGR